jgi:Uma2 family endonuclease
MYSETNTTFYSPSPLAVLDAPRKEPRRYTLAEFLRRMEQKEGYYEYYDGIITKLPMARGPHNTITANAITTLNNALFDSDKDYQVMSGQQLVYLPTLNFSLIPDALVVTDTPQYFDTNEVLLINPIVIVEVLSKSTKKYDQTDKFDEYRTLDSFKEYVLIDQKKCHIEVRYRTDRNTWHYETFTDINGTIFLKSLGCSISVAKIYRKITFV